MPAETRGGPFPCPATLVFSSRATQWVSHEEWHPDRRGKWLDDSRFQLEVPYTDPTELAMDVLHHADEVAIVSDTGGIGNIVRERTRRAWELHCAEPGV